MYAHIPKSTKQEPTGGRAGEIQKQKKYPSRFLVCFFRDVAPPSSAPEPSDFAAPGCKIKIVQAKEKDEMGFWVSLFWVPGKRFLFR